MEPLSYETGRLEAAVREIVRLRRLQAVNEDPEYRQALAHEIAEEEQIVRLLLMLREKTQRQRKREMAALAKPTAIGITVTEAELAELGADPILYVDSWKQTVKPLFLLSLKPIGRTDW